MHFHHHCVCALPIRTIMQKFCEWTLNIFCRVKTVNLNCKWSKHWEAKGQKGPQMLIVQIHQRRRGDIPNGFGSTQLFIRPWDLLEHLISDIILFDMLNWYKLLNMMIIIKHPRLYLTGCYIDCLQASTDVYTIASLLINCLIYKIWWSPPGMILRPPAI